MLFYTKPARMSSVFSHFFLICGGFFAAFYGKSAKFGRGCRREKTKRAPSLNINSKPGRSLNMLFKRGFAPLSDRVTELCRPCRVLNQIFNRIFSRLLYRTLYQPLNRRLNQPLNCCLNQPSNHRLNQLLNRRLNRQFAVDAFLGKKAFKVFKSPRDTADTVLRTLVFKRDIAVVACPL